MIYIQIKIDNIYINYLFYTIKLKKKRQRQDSNLRGKSQRISSPSP
jgi:hypothetical protein